MHTRGIRKFLLAGAVAFLSVLPGCDDDDDDDDTNPTSDDNAFRDVPLVTDTAVADTSGGLGLANQDTNLVNPWGMVMADGQHFWVSNQGTGTSTVYNGTGDSSGPTVKIPGRDSAQPGSPTGMVRNTTNFFKLPDGSGPAIYLFAGEDGTISGWRTGTSAKTIVTAPEDSAVYKGITIATDSGRPFLYVTNFKAKKVVVFDTGFKRDSVRAFKDPNIPAGFGPFNIAKIGNQIYVTYALVGSEGEDDEPGAGNGYINVFTPGGVFVKRFASQGSLNSPWGMTQSSGNFGPFSNALFVGNFGDGHILAYDSNGNLLGEVNGLDRQPAEVEGLWEILWVPSGTVSGVSGNSIWYTAGPGDESHGIFGYFIHP